MATRWGIASSGLISQDFVNAISIHPPSEHQVVAVAARSKDSAQKFADKFGIPKAHEGYLALAQDPDVEVVYVGAINTAHRDITKMMLENGKHVICEKPLGMNFKETREMVALAREKNLFMMEAIWSRCLPSYAEVGRLLEAGVIGEVKNVIVSFGKYIEAARLHKKELGGGTVLDLGIYCVQFASLAMVKVRPEKVIAGGHLGPGGCDESTSTTLIYSEGRTATLLTSAMADLPCEALIVGTKGNIKLREPFWTALSVESPEGTQSWTLPAGAKLQTFNYGNGENMSFESQHVRDCLKAGRTESNLVSLDETLLIAEIMEQIRKQVGVVYPQDE